MGQKSANTLPEPRDGLSRMFEDYYLDYASYVILERAIPHIKDGLKPVQRRILYSLQEMDDGRYNKVANVIGHCMRYHPHGDAAIGDALVNLGQKGLLLDTQGNWGHPITGDRAAAPRYIEVRLTAFARDVLLQKDITQWQPSYDGRFQEPVTLPVKFPLLLFLGVEGIAVGLAAKILPHNFCELMAGCMASLKNESFQLFPDFPGGGLLDVTEYEGGLRGGRVRVRANIQILSHKSLVITEIPHDTTTQLVIDSIIAASEKGHFKIKKIENNTTDQVEIVVHLKSTEKADKVRDALYVFTKCEVTIATNSCVIKEGKPVFLDVHELVRYSAEHTKDLLLQELKVEKAKLEEKIFLLQLERIFIENKVYKVLEKARSKEHMMDAVAQKLGAYEQELSRAVQEKDLEHLIAIPIRRISLFDGEALKKRLKEHETELRKVKKNIRTINDYAYAYFDNILKKYGKDFPRKSRITTFKSIQKSDVAGKSERVYIQRQEGFVGTALKKEEFLLECSKLDEIICIAESGVFKVVQPQEKVHIAKNLIYADVFQRGNKNLIYNVIYRKGSQGPVMVKRCVISAITRHREYSLTGGEPKSKVLYLSVSSSSSAGPAGADVETAEKVDVKLLQPRGGRALRKKNVVVDFAEYAPKGRDSKGVILTRASVRTVVPLRSR